MTAHTAALVFHPRRKARLARLGDWMAANRRLLLGAQWTIVVAYTVLLVAPAILPVPASGASILNNLTLFAQFAFWGIWWPFVILSIM
ncbi:MAG: 4Fe-4S binding protein, partial [Rhodocyclaceae bacterium]|nr:4Fe-4S binding protein [Rhodocyclaceae bacterium]